MHSLSLISDRQGAPPTAIVFYQGETDATREELAAAYADKLDAFVLAARTDLSLPDLPVVVVRGCTSTRLVSLSWLMRAAWPGGGGRVICVCVLGRWHWPEILLRTRAGSSS